MAKFNIVKLSKIKDNPVAKAMLQAFKKRYNDKNELSDISMYINDPGSYEGDKMLQQLTLESLYKRLMSSDLHQSF